MVTTMVFKHLKTKHGTTIVVSGTLLLSPVVQAACVSVAGRFSPSVSSLGSQQTHSDPNGVTSPAHYITGFVIKSYPDFHDMTLKRVK